MSSLNQDQEVSLQVFVSCRNLPPATDRSTLGHQVLALLPAPVAVQPGAGRPQRHSRLRAWNQTRPSTESGSWGLGLIGGHRDDHQQPVLHHRQGRNLNEHCLWLLLGLLALSSSPITIRLSEHLFFIVQQVPNCFVQLFFSCWKENYHFHESRNSTGGFLERCCHLQVD